jgi:hypothetical protein
MMVRWFQRATCFDFQNQERFKGVFSAGNIVEKPGENRKQGYFQ